jgi:hypothetical protein
MMLSLSNFGTVAGAAAVTLAIVKVVTALWASAPRIWVTWAAAEVTTFAYGLATHAITWATVLTIFLSGIVVAATAMGSSSGAQGVAQAVRKNRS